MGDGCAMEGISHEAASLAGHWKLNKLTLIYDDNCNTIDGPTSLTFSEDISARFRALGWNAITVDNIHDNMGSIEDALFSALNETRKPTFIRVCVLAGPCYLLFTFHSLLSNGRTINLFICFAKKKDNLLAFLCLQPLICC